MARLVKWQAERDLKKKIEAAKKQPIFKIGVPHHNFYSPKSKDPPAPHCHRNPHKNQPVSSPKLSRVTRQRILARKEAAQTASSAASSTSLDVSQPSTSTRPKQTPKRGRKSAKIPVETVASIAPENYSFKGPIGLVPMPMFGKITIPPLKDFRFDNRDDTMENKIDESSEATPENIIKHPRTPINKLTESIRASSPVPAQFSPFIVTSRGKSSARKEQKVKMGLNNSAAEDIPTKDTVMQSLNISIEDEEKTAQYYKFLLEKEEKKLIEFCDQWKLIQEDPHTSEDGKSLINQTIGQTDLLLRKKFKRFRSLVADCETGKGEMLVTSRDLGGFWETLSMDIRNCESRFEKITQSKANNWADSPEEKEMPVKRRKKRPLVKKNEPKIAAKSNFREFINAARREKNIKPTNIEENEQNQLDNIPSTSGSVKTPRSKIKSKIRGNADNSPLILMKISQAIKTPEVKLDSSIFYVNSAQTPGKGILKKSEFRTATPMKSAHKVNFDENLLKKLNESTGVEKKLDFSDDSIDEKEINFIMAHEPIIVQQPLATNDLEAKINFVVPTPKVKTPKKSTKKNIKVEAPVITLIQPTPRAQTPQKLDLQTPEKDINEGNSTRVLRSRSITMNSTPKKTRKSLKEELAMINKSLEGSKENNYPETKDTELLTGLNKRKSARRSVKLDIEEDCTGCAGNKIVLPGTPRRKRNGVSLLAEANEKVNGNIPKALANGDLICFDSPVAREYFSFLPYL